MTQGIRVNEAITPRTLTGTSVLGFPSNRGTVKYTLEREHDKGYKGHDPIAS